MKCQKIRTILDQAVEEHAVIPCEIDEHVGTCPECAAYYKEQLRLWSMLDLLPTVEPRLGFNERFWRRVREEKSPARLMSGWALWLPDVLWRRAAVGGAFVMLLALASVMVLNNQLAPPIGSKATIGTNLEDEQLLESLGIISSATSASALETYDLWRTDTEEPPDFPTPLLIPQGSRNSDSPIRGANHEKIG